MIGDEYFQIRAQLGTAVFSLSTLAHDLNADADLLQTLQGLSTSLREPFLFVVVGEVKAGKSSVLNALFGREFCRVDVLPATDKIYVFKHGDADRDVNVTDKLTECYRANMFLRDFNVVDTPGTNTIVAEHQTITEQFLPMADLVLFVFSVTNPWAQSAWDFLNLVHRKWLKNVVFLVQQADLRTPLEVEAVVKHLEQTAREKLGENIPVFAVSAKQALLAKTTATDKEALLAQSNFPKLEAHINQAVAGGEARRGKLQSVCQTSRVILGDLAEKTRGAFQILKQDGEKLANLNISLAERKDQSMRQVGGVLWTLAQSYERSQKRGEELLREKLSFFETLKLVFRHANWKSEFEEKIETKLQESIKRQIQNSVELLEVDLKNVWQQVHETLQKGFATEFRAPAGAPGFLKERNELLQRIELTLIERMSNRQANQEMTRLFAETAAWLRVPAGVAAVGGIATIAAALAHLAIVDVTGTIAGVAAVFGTTVALVKRNKIITQFQKEMAAKREEVLSPIEDQLRHAIGMFYQELATVFEPLQNFCSSQRKIYEPMLTRIKQLEETFGKCAADLGITQSK